MPAKKKSKAKAKARASAAVFARLAKNCDTTDSPKEFFAELVPYFIEWLKWSSEIDACWDSTCGDMEATKGLNKLCKEFAKWAEDAQKWGDEVEECFQDSCSLPPDHTTPPPPPFI